MQPEIPPALNDLVRHAVEVGPEVPPEVDQRIQLSHPLFGGAVFYNTTKDTWSYMSPTQNGNAESKGDLVVLGQRAWRAIESVTEEQMGIFTVTFEPAHDVSLNEAWASMDKRPLPSTLQEAKGVELRWTQSFMVNLAMRNSASLAERQRKPRPRRSLKKRRSRGKK